MFVTIFCNFRFNSNAQNVKKYKNGKKKPYTGTILLPARLAGG